MFPLFHPGALFLPRFLLHANVDLLPIPSGTHHKRDIDWLPVIVFEEWLRYHPVIACRGSRCGQWQVPDVQRELSRLG